MYFDLIPTAEASVTTLMQGVNKFVLNPLILFMFAAALVYFLYGVVQYLVSPDDEEVRTTSKSHMLYGVIGMFIMMSVFGIMRIILNTFGENHIKITDNGEISVVSNSSTGFTDIGNPADPLPEPDYNPDGTLATFTPYKFKNVYIPDANCWRGTVESAGITEASAQKQAQLMLQVRYKAANPSTVPYKLGENEPVIVEASYPAVYDAYNKIYHFYAAAVQPKPGVSASCGLLAVATDDQNGTNRTSQTGIASSEPEVKDNYAEFSTGADEKSSTRDTVSSTGSWFRSTTGAWFKADTGTYNIKTGIADSQTGATGSKTGAQSSTQKRVGITSRVVSSTGTPGYTSNNPLALVFESNLSRDTAVVGPVIGIMKDKYKDSASEYVIVASGMGADLATAKSYAVENGKRMLATKKGLKVNDPLVYMTLEEHAFLVGTTTHYWIAMSSPR